MIEVIHYERANKNKIIGYVDIKISLNGMTMIVRKISHVQSGDKKWFNLPTFARDVKGTDKPLYLKYWQFDLDAHNGQLLEKLTEKVTQYCEQNKIEEVKPLNFASTMNSMSEL